MANGQSPKPRTTRTQKAAASAPFKSISTPLGFFVLSLLIVETFLGTVTTVSPLSATERITVIWLGVGMFVLIVLLVTALVWFKPDNLTFDKDAHLRDRQKTNRPDEQPKAAEIVSDHVRSSVVDIIGTQGGVK